MRLKKLQFGIGGNFNKGKQSDYVLSKWSKEEKSKLITYESVFYQIIYSFAISGIESTMNQFNTK